ncbi:NmrA family NAD(P)-binding protein [Oceanicoccus sp. KOV_DT_Chl]|uniref:NmrA family NAD(P)-binding protein n=1 Tax=Oceanicoccus sp. KOV_DT_Chl TaxID=1904639 RepID=UPI000C7A48B7|nr:NmrA family NAD(P)-binding protein [Oceanicoccus sp. KOV_DT_Chl]
MDRNTAVRLGQEAIKRNNKKLIDAVLAIKAERPELKPKPVDQLPLIGVTCATGWECYAIVEELCNTGLFRVRAMYRTPGTTAEKRLQKLLSKVEQSSPGLLTLRPHTDMNSEDVLTEAFAGCEGVVIYVTANTSKAGKITNHGNDPAGGRAAVMKQVQAVAAAMHANGVKHGVTLVFPTDKVRGIVDEAPEAPWWIQQRHRISDFLREQGLNITCIHRPAYYYGMHRVDHTATEDFRGDTAMSRNLIHEDYMPCIMEKDFMVNWVDVRDVGKWVGTCFEFPEVFSNQNFSVASCALTGEQRSAMAEKLNKHGTTFKFKRFPPFVMRMISLYNNEVIYPLRYTQWYNDGANGYDFASEEDLADLDRIHPRWTFDKKLQAWGIDEIKPAKGGR